MRPAVRRLLLQKADWKIGDRSLRRSLLQAGLEPRRASARSLGFGSSASMMAAGDVAGVWLVDVADSCRNLGNNNLTGLLPDLTGMNSLNYVDLSNNSFDPSVAPLWFSTLPTLTTLVMEFGSLQGPVPEKLFSLPELQEVKLKYNTFNGTLNMGDNISLQLELVDLQNNQISHLTIEEEYRDALILKGNPICSGSLSNTTWCQ